MKFAKGGESLDRTTKGECAFSRIDLLAVLAAATILGLIQIAAVASSKGNSHRVVCADNLRRLTLSWLMYAEDNRGKLAPNGDTFPSTNKWVAGVLDFGSNIDNTNLATITRARLYPYNKAAEIYHCPDDLSTVRGQLRIRSYSMNGWVGDGAIGWILNNPSALQIMANRSQVRQPDGTFVFVEEHPDSINDGALYVDMERIGPAARIIDFPAAHHYLGANLGFADGSARYRQWLDPRTTPTPRYNNTMALNIPSPNNPDLTWLQSVTTYRK
jgi:hypothetical protein